MVGGVGWVSTAPWQTWMGIPIGRTPGGVNPFGEKRERDNRPEQTRKKESLEARLNGTKEGIKGEKGRRTYSFHPHTHPSSSIPVGKALSKRKQAGTPWWMWREGFPERGLVEVGLCTPKGLESERQRERERVRESERERARERESEHLRGRALLGLSRERVGEGEPTVLWAPDNAAPGTAEPERGKPERGCSSRCPHEGARAPSGPRCGSEEEAGTGESCKAPNGQAPPWGGWSVERSAPTASTQRMCGCVLGPRDSLLPDTSCQAEGRGVPSGFGGGWAAWWGGSGFRRLEACPGCWRARGSSRGRRPDPHSLGIGP